MDPFLASAKYSFYFESGKDLTAAAGQTSFHEELSIDLAAKEMTTHFTRNG
jgi:hypothetical protein